MREQTRDIPMLIARSGHFEGQRWSLDCEQIVIGRGSDADLNVQDRQVSRYHARIRKAPEGYVIEDLGSKNGTHLNGSKIPGPILLQDGDIIQIALAMELIYVDSEATMPLSVPQSSRISVGRLQMDPQAHRVTVADVEIDPPLSPPQYRLLEMLYRNGDRVVTRDEIAEIVWPGTHGMGVSNQAIDALVRRLRDRLQEVDPNRSYIITVRGRGFRLENPS